MRMGFGQGNFKTVYIAELDTSHVKQSHSAGELYVM